MTLRSTKFLLTLAILFALLFSVAPHAFADDEENEGDVDSYAECVKSGGATTTVQSQSFPTRQIATCSFDGKTFERGAQGKHDDDGDDGDNKLFKRGPFATSTGSSTRAELRKERKEELHAKLAERMSERLQNVLDKINNRLENAIERLERSAERIGNHIEGYEEKHSVELTEAKEHLADGIEFTEDASAALASTTAYLSGIIDDENATSTLRAHKEDLKAMYRNVKDLIKKAHAELVNAITEIRAATNENDEESDND